MESQIKNIEGMTFDCRTTLSKLDYGGQGIYSPLRDKTSYKTVYQREPQRKQRPYRPLKDIRTMCNIKKGVYIPFTLFHKDKEIIRTDPRHIMEKKALDPNLGSSGIPKEDSKILVCLDEYPPPAVVLKHADDEGRDRIIKHTYKSIYNIATNDVTSRMRYSSWENYLPDVYGPTNTVTLDRCVPPAVSPEWRMQSVRWELGANRDFLPRTRTFWLTRKPKVEKKKTEEVKKIKTKRY